MSWMCLLSSHNVCSEHNVLCNTRSPHMHTCLSAVMSSISPRSNTSVTRSESRGLIPKGSYIFPTLRPTTVQPTRALGSTYYSAYLYKPYFEVLHTVRIFLHSIPSIKKLTRAPSRSSRTPKLKLS